MSSRTARVLFLAAITLRAAAQIGPSQTSPRTLVEQALTNANVGEPTQTRFTRSDLEHSLTRNAKGKLTFDRTTLYEDTWIADLPYKRVVQVDNKPLAGKDLAAENARYEKAVAEGKSLDLAARAKLQHVSILESGLGLTDVLTPSFRVTELRRESLPQPTGPPIPTRVIEADPVATGDPSDPGPDKHFVFWITAQNPTILRFTFDILRDEPGLLAGTNGQKDFQMIEGIPVEQHSTLHILYPEKGKTVTVDSEQTFSDYRRFETSARSLPAPPR